eukprot:scaffold248912_cov30-Tisochrysis_lutea.AAC.1
MLTGTSPRITGPQNASPVSMDTPHARSSPDSSQTPRIIPEPPESLNAPNSMRHSPAVGSRPAPMASSGPRGSPDSRCTESFETKSPLVCEPVRQRPRLRSAARVALGKRKTELERGR